MKTRRLLCGLLAAAAPLSPASPTGTASGVTRPAISVGHDDPVGAAAYWTPLRMATATPLDARLDTRGALPGLMPSAHATSGSAVVGALFCSNGAGRHYSTASVVATPKRNLLITAAHCLYSPSRHVWNRHIVFVPKYSQGRRPYGTWPVWLMVADRRWIEGGDEDADYGFAAVQIIRGRRIADVVGANRLLVGEGYVNRVTVIGYPSKASYPSDRPIRCTATTARQADHQMRFDCRGFYGGTSGSPWIEGYDERTQSGYVIGTIGGYQKGGEYDWRSYSPLFDDDIARLIVAANDQA